MLRLKACRLLYEVQGREYVVFCAAAQATTFTQQSSRAPCFASRPIPGAYVAFALPRP